MKKIFIALTILLFLGSNNKLFSQVEKSPSIDWVFFLDGYNTTDLSDLIVDKEGNTYFSANYSMDLTIPELKKKLPYSRHVIGTLIKLDKNGRAQWAHAFESSFDNRVKDIAFAKNGDILLTGHTDGVTAFPSKRDTLRLGKKKPKGQYHRYQYMWIARYKPNGKRVWAKVLQAPWGEGASIASDQLGNIYWSMYHKGTLRMEGEVIDSISDNSNSRVSIFKLNEEGEIVKKLPLQYSSDRSSTTVAPELKVDSKNNLIVYGLFRSKIHLTDSKTLTNDGYYDGHDAFLAKYNTKGQLLWSKKIGGQNSEQIQDLVIDKKDRIYTVGSFSYECVISGGIELVQRSKFEYKSGRSFFYARFGEDGELHFSRFHSPNGYSTTAVGVTSCLDPSGYTHISGAFTDTLTLDGQTVIGNRHGQTSFNCVWQNDSMISLSRPIYGSAGWSQTVAMRSNGNQLVAGGFYYGKLKITMSNGKKVKFSNYEHGRASFVYGGKIPELPPLEEQEIDTQDQGLLSLKSLPACFSPLVEQAPDVWFPYKEDEAEADTIASHENMDCGVKIKSREASLFPNPTKSNTTLELKGMQGLVLIEISNNQGQILLSQQLEVRESERSVQFDMSNSADGLYYITVAQKGYKKVFRLIKAN